MQRTSSRFPEPPVWRTIIAYDQGLLRALLADAAGPGPFAVLDGAGTLLAVYERRGAGVKPAVVCAP